MKEHRGQGDTGNSGQSISDEMVFLKEEKSLGGQAWRDLCEFCWFRVSKD